eukprot:6098566-Amphidinium_carterae.1
MTYGFCFFLLFGGRGRSRFMRKAFCKAAATSILIDMDSMGSLTRMPLLKANMPVLASEAMRGLSHDMLVRAWKHLALEEHELLEDVVGQTMVA